MNEAYLRLVDTSRIRWESRGHFLAVAAQAMRRVLLLVPALARDPRFRALLERMRLTDVAAAPAAQA